MKSILFLALAAVLNLRADISVATHFEDIPERGRVLQYIVQCGGQRFQVSPPPGWQMQVQPSENRIVFQHELLGAVFTIEFSESPAPSNPSDITEQLAGKYPGARPTEQFPCVARDATGQALDLEFPAANGSSFASRVGLLGYGACHIQLALTGPAESIRKSHLAWVTVLNSLSRY